MMQYFADNWGYMLQVAGGISEIFGGLLLANRYLNVRFHQVPKLILTSLRPGQEDDVGRVVYELSAERVKTSLRGIFFLCLGFFLQTLPSLAALADAAFD
jgi:hypothetical protein